MKERPILFSGPMVRAILAGTKTQTRRVVRWPAWTGFDEPGPGYTVGADPAGDSRPVVKDPEGRAVGYLPCPYGVPGDRLWVRETFTYITGNGRRIHYRADGEPRDRQGRVTPTEPGVPRWAPSIFMRRAESRITLEVTEVRVQRLQDISEEDARAEGAPAYWTVPLAEEPESAQRLANALASGGATEPGSHITGFRALWDSINGDRAPWASNPWVWAVSFRRVQP